MGHRNRDWNGPGDRRARGGLSGQPGGPPPWVPGLIGHGPWAGRSAADFGGGRGPLAAAGPEVRRGDVRAAILDVLHADVEPINGYQVIQQIAERSDGAWKPSPGSVYPTVQQLEDEGLVEDREDAGRRLLRLTEEGRTLRRRAPRRAGGRVGAVRRGGRRRRRPAT